MIEMIQQDWIQIRIDDRRMTELQQTELLDALKIVRRWMPDLDEKMRTMPERHWSAWRRWVWYSRQ